jgi:periplasmic protein TonB
MFETLLASHLPAMRWRPPALIALLLHGLIIGAAAAMSGRGSTPPAAERDTIRLDLPLRQPPSPPSPPAPALPGAPFVPPVDFRRRPEIRLDFPLSPPPSVLGILGDRQTHAGDPGIAFGGGASPADSAFSTGDVDRLPELTGEVLPRYPSSLQRSGLSGVVELEYVISAAGRVDSTTVRALISSHPEFVRSAIDALLQARFKPALRAGRPVPVRVQQKFRFVVR